MGRQRSRLAGIVALVLATGCASVGVGRSADLPNEKPYPMPHRPDATVTARETETRFEKRTDIFSMKTLPLANWALMGAIIVF